MFIFRRIFLNKSLAKKSKPIQSIKDIESIYMAFIHNTLTANFVCYCCLAPLIRMAGLVNWILSSGTFLRLGVDLDLPYFDQRSINYQKIGQSN